MADVLRSFAPYLVYSYASFVGWTSRVRWEGLEHLRGLERRGLIYAFWHQRQAFFTYTHRAAGIHALVSRSKDGELIATTMALSRISAVRGSSSRRASAAALELLDLLNQGRKVAITPDGPRGPARQVKPGALFLALKSGCPIIPITNAVHPRIEIKKAWDHFQVPLPFARICVRHAPPIFVRPEDDLESKARELKEALDRITGEAEERVA